MQHQYFPPPSVYYSSPQQAAAAVALQQQQQLQQPQHHPTLATYSQQPMAHAFGQAQQAGMMASFQPTQLQSVMHQQQQQQQQHLHLQQQQQQQQATMSYAAPLLHYSPSAGSSPFGYYGQAAVPGQPAMTTQPMFGVVPPHLQQLYASQAAHAQLGYAASQPQSMLPSFTALHSPHAQAVQQQAAMQQPSPIQLAAVQHAAAPSGQNQQQQLQLQLQQQSLAVPRVAALVALPSQPPATIATSLQAAAPMPISAPISTESTTSTAAASIAAGMQPAAAIPALRSTFAAAGQPIPAHFRPQPPIHSAALPPPLTNISSSSTTLSMSPLDGATSAAIASFTTASSSAPFVGAADSSSDSKQRRGGGQASAMAAADASLVSSAPTRRPVLLHSRSAMLPSSSATVSRSPAAMPSAVGLTRPALTAQRSLPVVSSASLQWRASVGAAERSRASDKLAMQLVACQLDVDQLLTLAACMAEESLYERAASRLDYMKLSIELQHTIARLPVPRIQRTTSTASSAATPSTAASSSAASDADVTGLLALAQSSVEQKQSELVDWGQRVREDDEGLGEEMRKRRRERADTSGAGMRD